MQEPQQPSAGLLSLQGSPAGSQRSQTLRGLRQDFPLCIFLSMPKEIQLEPHWNMCRGFRPSGG